MPPFLSGLLRLLLILLGAAAIVSAIVNIIAAVQLLEPSDAEAIGLSRGFVVTEYSVQLLFGAVMLFFGFRRRRPRK